MLHTVFSSLGDLHVMISACQLRHHRPGSADKTHTVLPIVLALGPLADATGAAVDLSFPKQALS
jgi:hypothetical protein